MNRNKLIDLLISNLSNAILHDILEKAVSIPEIAEKYHKEIKNSWQIAQEYRKKINPQDSHFSERDTEEIREKIIKNVRTELLLRISKGYTNIPLNLVEEFVDKALKELNVTNP